MTQSAKTTKAVKTPKAAKVSTKVSKVAPKVMRKLHFLWSNDAQFALEIPAGTNILQRVKALVEFVGVNNAHVKSHKSCYTSGTRVKFPVRTFFVGFDNGDGKIKTLLTPEMVAIKYSGKALTSDMLASEIEHRVNVLLNGNKVPFVACNVALTPDMQKVVAIDKSRKVARLNKG